MLWVFETIHGGLEQARGTYGLRESSEAYGGEFAQENEALTSKNTIPWQKFTETAENLAWSDP